MTVVICRPGGQWVGQLQVGLLRGGTVSPPSKHNHRCLLHLHNTKDTERSIRCYCVVDTGLTLDTVATGRRKWTQRCSFHLPADYVPIQSHAVWTEYCPSWILANGESTWRVQRSHLFHLLGQYHDFPQVLGTAFLRCPSCPGQAQRCFFKHEKSNVSRTSLRFLEYVASSDKVQMDPDETEAVSLNCCLMSYNFPVRLDFDLHSLSLTCQTSYKLTHYNPFLHMNNFQILQCAR